VCWSACHIRARAGQAATKCSYSISAETLHFSGCDAADNDMTVTKKNMMSRMPRMFFGMWQNKVNTRDHPARKRIQAKEGIIDTTL